MAKAKFRLSLLVSGILVVSIAVVFQCADAAEYTLTPSPQTVHVGHFNAALKPVLTINSGDTVTIETATRIDPANVDRSGVVPPSAVPQYVRYIYREVRDRGPGAHILSGPILVNGALPGDVLEVRIQDIELATDYGYNVQQPYRGALPDEFPGVFQRVIKIDRNAKTAEIAPDVVVPVNRPFFGTLGVAPPPAMGRISSGPPGVHTGNLDNKDIAAGTTLYMPIYAAGALFSVGDGHAAQGQGEVDLSAIETGMRGNAAFRLISGSSRCRLTRSDGDDLPPSLHGHYPAS
jgi:acetamidase/formamidase